MLNAGFGMPAPEWSVRQRQARGAVGARRGQSVVLRVQARPLDQVALAFGDEAGTVSGPPHRFPLRVRPATRQVRQNASSSGKRPEK